MEAAHDCEAHFDASLVHESTPVPADSATSAMTTNSLNIPPRMLCTGIMDMPNEILREIFISIDGEFSKTLWSLSLTCKHFRDIVEEHCEPEYNVRGKWIEDPYALMERLRDQPRLTRLIRVLRMDCDSAKHTKHTEEEVQRLVRSLELEPFNAAVLQCWGDALTKDDGGTVWPAILLPQVETIELSMLEDNSETQWHTFIYLLNKVSDQDSFFSQPLDKLRNLALLRHLSHSEPELDAPVLQLPSLKTVRLHNVRFEQHVFNQDLDALRFEGLSFVNELHFQALSQASQARSLEDLQLYSNEPYRSFDGVPIDISVHCHCPPSLKNFQKLKSLALTNMSLVGLSGQRPGHWHQPVEDTLKHLAGMFPPSLEVFTHLLGDWPSCFADAQSKEHQRVYSSENIWKASTKDMFPSLKIVMTQKYGLDGLAKEREVIWQRED
ncbi:hypothetical protein EKO04_001047 [Ascochyta lentis]|uniref:F-box domain-containing protein n=1 Tax=Ascochyta lentis TaxID=205686 RepID=A0A8H7JDY4_9PLEO|nr:hypothetical protein EKO04_001047 [Ascochyta lentis]